MKVLIALSCLTLCNPLGCSAPGSSVHGILQARIRQWVIMLFSGGSSWPWIAPGSRALRTDSLLPEPPETFKLMHYIENKYLNAYYLIIKSIGFHTRTTSLSVWGNISQVKMLPGLFHMWESQRSSWVEEVVSSEAGEAVGGRVYFEKATSCLIWSLPNPVE